MKIHLLFFIVLFLSEGSVAVAQQKDNGRYLVFEFKINYKITQHSEKRFYWIVDYNSKCVSLDSLKIFYIQEVGDSILCRLASGIDFSLYDFSRFSTTDTLKKKDAFNNELRKLRGKFLPLQAVTKKWQQNGQELFLQVSFIPVKGNLVVGKLDSMSKINLGYSGGLVFPIGKVEYDQGFSLSNLNNEIKRLDFSNFKFDIVPPIFGFFNCYREWW